MTDDLINNNELSNQRIFRVFITETPTAQGSSPLSLAHSIPSSIVALYPIIT
jgi:hypothetical protein